MPTAERLSLHLQRLAEQRLSGGEFALGHQQPSEVVHGGERVRMPIAERLAQPLQRLAAERLRGGEVAFVTLGQQQPAEVADGEERARMPTAVRLACHLQYLAEQRLGLIVLALGVLAPGLQVQSRTQGGG